MNKPNKMTPLYILCVILGASFYFIVIGFILLAFRNADLAGIN
jgi:hypothetical protein